MITINKLRIDDTLKNIEVDIKAGTTAARFTNVFVWDHLTFRDYQKAKDVSSLLAKTSDTETFIISAEMLEVERIDKVYFVEFRTDESPTPLDNGLIQNQILGVVANLYQYHECLLDKSLSVDVTRCGKSDPNCYECQDSITSFNLLSSLMQALDAGIQTSLFEGVVKIVNDIEKVCTNCDGCPDYEETRAINGAGLGYQIIQNEIVDSGVEAPTETPCVEGTCGESLVAKCVLAHIYTGEADVCTINEPDVCYDTVLYYPNTVSDSVPWLSPVYSDPNLTQEVTYPNLQAVFFKYSDGGSPAYDLLEYDANQSRFESGPCIA